MNVPIALAALQTQAAEPVRLREIPYNYTSFSDRVTRVFTIKNIAATA